MALILMFRPKGYEKRLLHGKVCFRVRGCHNWQTTRDRADLDWIRTLERRERAIIRQR